MSFTDPEHDLTTVQIMFGLAFILTCLVAVPFTALHALCTGECYDPS